MKNYKVETLKLMSMSRENGIFDCEDKVSFEDKIAFVDRFNDGKLSYLIAIAEKFAVEKDTLKKDAYGDIKTVSKQAWLRRNDTRDIISRTVSEWWDSCGAFKMLGLRGNTIQGNVFRYTSQSSIQKLVDDCFHVQLEDCLLEEKRYYNEHNEDQKLIKAVCMSLENYGYPQNHCFHTRGNSYIVPNKTYHTDEYGIELHKDNEAVGKLLTVEETKALAVALAPVEEKYQRVINAKVEMEVALQKAGLDFATYLNTKNQCA